MEAKEIVQKAYDLFGSGDMESFMNEIVHEDMTWTFPGDESKHPLAGVHQGKESCMANFAKIPENWNNFTVKPISMISEGNKVFAIIKGTADGMDTLFGHYFEIEDNKTKVMMTFDDTLSAFNAMIK
jgi:ketosteroid isomerase-like protein